MDIKIRPANISDLDAINQLIESAIMIWNLPQRVKRLSLSSVTYSEHDFQHYQITVAEISNTLTGVLILDHDTYRKEKTCLIHGIYVDPEWQKKGIGTRLLKEAETLALAKKSMKILVKAQRDAQDFFIASGMNRIPVEKEQNDYAMRYVKKLN